MDSEPLRVPSANVVERMWAEMGSLNSCGNRGGTGFTYEDARL